MSTDAVPPLFIQVLLRKAKQMEVPASRRRCLSWLILGLLEWTGSEPGEGGRGSLLTFLWRCVGRHGYAPPRRSPFLDTECAFGVETDFKPFEEDLCLLLHRFASRKFMFVSDP